jgi:hypothetical protein
MNTTACQSLSTLRELLREAAYLVNAAPPYRAAELVPRLDALRRKLDTNDSVSAEMEQEIVSVREIAWLHCREGS